MIAFAFFSLFHEYTENRGAAAPSMKSINECIGIHEIACNFASIRPFSKIQKVSFP
jgi:hypothetical protein